MASKDQKQSVTDSVAETLQPFVVGGIAAMFASACIHPIDLSKVRLQLHHIHHPGQPRPHAATILTNMIKTEGFFSIYSGLTASLLRQALYGSARIGLHRTFTEYVKDRQNRKPLSFGMKTVVGMASGAIAVCIGNPMDVALVRMQADSMTPDKSKRRGYTSVINALMRITKEEGFRKLYTGLSQNVLRGMAMNAGMLACFDQVFSSFLFFFIFHFILFSGQRIHCS
jgi:solute carrier family 25 oxoglutarate transporter 11